MLHLALEAALALLTLCGIAFYLIALWSAREFQREKAPILASTSLPRISILKALKGADSHTYSALRSHCQQEYGTYEILFGVNDADDDAAQLVRKLAAEFPNRDITLLVCEEVFGSNLKVSNLIHLLRRAKYEYIVVNDGDIKVSPTYLQTVIAGFRDPKVGMVTCLYKGAPAETLGSRLEALGIATDFAPGVLTARLLDHALRFGLGSTLAMSRSALERIGSFPAVVDFLADDYELGKRVADAGFKVELSQEVVETSIPAYSFPEFWQHQLRWARTMRVSRPSGYRGLIFTYALPWAILLAMITPNNWWCWTLLATALVTRCAVALSVGIGILHDQKVIRNLWLLPVRDFFGVAIWFASYAGNKVTWRGREFRLEQGRMYPSSEAPSMETTKSAVHSENQR